MRTVQVFGVAAAVMIFSFTGVASAQPTSDGSIFFDTFDGPITVPQGSLGGGEPTVDIGDVNPTGGVSQLSNQDIPGNTTILTPPFEYPYHFVHHGREGIQTRYNNIPNALSREYQAILNNPPTADTEYVVRANWIVDEQMGGPTVNGENGRIMNGFQLLPETPALISLEVEQNGATTFDIEVDTKHLGGSTEDNLGLSLDFGIEHRITVHNLGNCNADPDLQINDCTADLWVNDQMIGNFPAGPGTLDVLGSLGNNSSAIGQGAQLFLAEVSIGLPGGTGPGLLLGDADNSDTVTADDLIVVQQNFGNVGPVGDGTDPGDANDDGTVTADDLISVQQNFGCTPTTSGCTFNGQPVGPASTPIPEPATLALLGLGALAVRRRR